MGRDPATLRISVNIGRDWLAPEGQVRVDLLAGYRELGVDRVMGLLPASVEGDEAIETAGGGRARRRRDAARSGRLMARDDARTIVCFGDSNTYGASPVDGTRLAALRALDGRAAGGAG